MNTRIALAALAAVTVLSSPADAGVGKGRKGSEMVKAPVFDVAAAPAYPTASSTAVAREKRASRGRGRVLTDPNGNPVEITHQRGPRASASTSRGCLTSDTRAVLEGAEARFGVTFVLVSTCRPGARIAGTSHMSEHSRGRAVDLLVPHGVSKAEVVRYLFDHAKGVTMTYRGMAHVHFDTGGYHKLACGGCGGKRHARQRMARRL